MAELTPQDYLRYGSSAVGNFMAASNALDTGAQSAAALRDAAKQLRIKAGEEQFTGQVKSAASKREADIIKSRAQAVAAAQGGSGADPTVLNVIADIEIRGRLNSLMDIYESTQKARTLNREAANKETQAWDVKKSANMQAYSNVLQGAVSLGSLFADV